MEAEKGNFCTHTSCTHICGDSLLHFVGLQFAGAEIALHGFHSNVG